MKLSVVDLQNYSFCPALFDQIKDKKVTFAESEENQLLRSFIADLAIRLMTGTESKLNVARFQNRLKRVFLAMQKNKCAIDERSHNRVFAALREIYPFYHKVFVDSVIMVQPPVQLIINDMYLSHVPVVLLQGDSASHMVVVAQEVNGVPSFASMAAIAGLAHAGSLKSIVHCVGFDDQHKFFYRSRSVDAYADMATLSLLSIHSAVKDGLTYPNTAGCSICPLRKECNLRGLT